MPVPAKRGTEPRDGALAAVRSGDDIGPDRQVTAETLLLASPPETAAEVAPSQYAAHAFVGFPEERPRNSAGISSGPDEGVAANRDTEGEISIEPWASRPDTSGHRIRSPHFQSRELQVPCQDLDIDREFGCPGNDLRLGRQAKQAAGPTRGARETLPLDEVALRTRT